MFKLYLRWYREGHTWNVCYITNFLKKILILKWRGRRVKGDFENNHEIMLDLMGAVLVANQINIIDSNIDDNFKLLQKFIRNQIK